MCLRFFAGTLIAPLAACVLASSAWATEINQANEAALDSVKGLGPSTTLRILQARDKKPFADWHDLMRRVKGIQPATAQKLSANGLTVNGAAFPPAEKP